MEQLIVLKQRIKTVETIRKVTHAMRLVSMSAHATLLEKKRSFEQYKAASNSLLEAAAPYFPSTETTTAPYQLIIVISSHKGLCGTFNSSLIKFFEKQVTHLPPHTHYIGIGSFAIDYLTKRKAEQQASYPITSPTDFVSTADAVADQIITSQIAYEKIIVYSTKEKSFFVQLPQEVVIYPRIPETGTTPSQSSHNYLIEQSPELLASILHRLQLSLSLQELLFNSLLSEQAARFISMDSSTRNADTLITKMKLGYNKVRQATITRELTELSATL